MGSCWFLWEPGKGEAGAGATVLVRGWNLLWEVGMAGLVCFPNWKILLLYPRAPISSELKIKRLDRKSVV